MQIPRISRAIVLGLCGTWIVAGGAGCTSLHYARDQAFTTEQIDVATAEGTPVQQVMRALGPPHQIGTTEAEEWIFVYDHLQVVEKQLGAFIPEVEWLKISVGQAMMDRELLVLLLRDGKVVSAEAKSWREELGRGAALQLLVKVAPTVDTTKARAVGSPGAWGRQLLVDGYVAVNQAAGLENGEKGIQIHGMPSPQDFRSRRRAY